MGKKYTQGVTPIGEAFFTNVLKTESFTKDGNTTDTGKYSVMLKLKESDKEAMLDKIEQEWDSYKNTLTGKKFKYDYSNGLKEYKEEEYLKFTMPAEIKCKSGEILKLTVPVFDCDMKEVSKKIQGIGNGSKVVVAYELRPFWMNDKNYGVSLRLTGMQIVDLVEFGAKTGESLGFGKIADGFSADKAEDDDTENPFTDVPPPEDDGEEDF